MSGDDPMDPPRGPHFCNEELAEAWAERVYGRPAGTKTERKPNQDLVANDLVEVCDDAYGWMTARFRKWVGDVADVKMTVTGQRRRVHTSRVRSVY